MVKRDEIKMIEKNDEAYPRRMRALGSMPEMLYVTGEMPDDTAPSVAIVGARLCSSYGRETAYSFGRELAKAGVQIISGMAAGVDCTAQEGALDGGGKSWAVLGCGVDVCYPRGNTSLYNRLRKQGGILSEQPPGTPPMGCYFPARNRIISALADVVLVVEAKQRSGSLITVDFALSQGKSVYAVPGRVGDALSDGCNYLIAQGASIAYAPEAILEELKILMDSASYAKSMALAASFRRALLRQVKGSSTLTPEAKKVYRALSFEDVFCPDQVAERAKMPIEDVRSALTQLLKEDLVKEAARDSYIRNKAPSS